MKPSSLSKIFLGLISLSSINAFAIEMQCSGNSNGIRGCTGNPTPTQSERANDTLDFSRMVNASADTVQLILVSSAGPLRADGSGVDELAIELPRANINVASQAAENCTRGFARGVNIRGARGTNGMDPNSSLYHSEGGDAGDLQSSFRRCVTDAIRPHQGRIIRAIPMVIKAPLAAVAAYASGGRVTLYRWRALNGEEMAKVNFSLDRDFDWNGFDPEYQGTAVRVGVYVPFGILRH